MNTIFLPLTKEENLNDWVSKKDTVSFEADNYTLRIQADYKNYENDPTDYSFATELDKEESIKLAKGILLAFNAI